MAPAGRLAAGRPAGRHPVAGEHGQENAAEVNVSGLPPLPGGILRPGGWWLNFGGTFLSGLGSRLASARWFDLVLS